MYKLDYPSPIGVLEIVGDSEVIHSILFVERPVCYERNGDTPAVLSLCYAELHSYFEHGARTFTFPYVVEGTPFQREVWEALTTIPYGETRSYQTLASQLNRDRAARAVGAANSKNLISIAVPCHRVIGANGTLTGYAGGLSRKEWLLNHERKQN